MGLMDDIAKLITDSSAVISKPMVEGVDFDMLYQSKNHKPIALPSGKIAIYSFYYNGSFLKISQSVIIQNINQNIILFWKVKVD